MNEVIETRNPQTAPVKTAIWRLLDVGETIQAGDEFHNRCEQGWFPTKDIGRTVLDSYFIYRRLVEVIL